MRAAVFIDQNQGFLNFVREGAFEALERDCEVCYVVPSNSPKRVSVDVGELLAGRLKVIVDHDWSRFERWQELSMIEQVRPFRGPYYRRLRQMRWMPLALKEKIKFGVLSFPGVNALYRRRVLRAMSRSSDGAMAGFLRSWRPDIVVHSSALNGAYINDLTQECKRADIPLLVLMNSWDNPSTKSITAIPHLNLAVWGRQTFEHAKRYMRLPEARISILGAPQLERYRLRPRQSRADFREQQGLRPSSRIVVFAGSSILGSDYKYLDLLEAAVERGLLGDAEILYRPYPHAAAAGDLKRIVGRRWVHVRMQRELLNRVDQQISGEATRGHEDLSGKHEVLAFADVVVSPLSTILVEAMLCGVQIVCFVPREDTDPLFLPRNAPLVHFEDVLRSPAAIVADEASSLVPSVVAALDRTSEPDNAARLRQAASQIVADLPGSYAGRLLDLCRKLVSERSSRATKALSGLVDEAC